QTGGRRQQTRRRWIKIAEFPLQLPSRGIDGAQRAVHRRIESGRALSRAPGVPLARGVLRPPGVKRRAYFARVDEEGLRARIEGGRPEIRAASDVGTRHRPLLVRLVTGAEDGPAVAVHFLGPV